MRVSLLQGLRVPEHESPLTSSSFARPGGDDLTTFPPPTSHELEGQPQTGSVNKGSPSSSPPRSRHGVGGFWHSGDSPSVSPWSRARLSFNGQDRVVQNRNWTSFPRRRRSEPLWPVWEEEDIGKRRGVFADPGVCSLNFHGLRDAEEHRRRSSTASSATPICVPIGIASSGAAVGRMMNPFSVQEEANASYGIAPSSGAAVRRAVNPFAFQEETNEPAQLEFSAANGSGLGQPCWYPMGGVSAQQAPCALPYGNQQQHCWSPTTFAMTIAPRLSWTGNRDGASANTPGVRDSRASRSRGLPTPQRGRRASSIGLSHHDLTPVQVVSVGSPARSGPVQAVLASSVSHEEEFLLLLLRALCAYGAPTLRMEHNLQCISQHLGVDSCFVVSPNLAWVSFGTTASHPQLRLFLIPLQQGLELSKLEDLNCLCNELFQSKIALQQAAEQLQKIVATSPTHPALANVMEILCYAVYGWTVCLTGFNGTWIESGFSFFTGLVCGILCYLASAFAVPYTNLQDFVSAMAVSCIAKVFQLRLAPGICLDMVVVTLSGIIVLVPGQGITLAVMELASKNIMSGTMRLFHAILEVIFLGFGAIIGIQMATWIAELLFAPSLHSSGSRLTSISSSASPAGPPQSSLRTTCLYPRVPLSLHWTLAILPIQSITLSICLKAKPSQWIPMMLVTLIAYGITSVQSPHLGMEACVTISALAVTLSSNFYSRITHRLGIAPLLAGLFLLFPGSVGVRGTLSFLLDNDVLSAANFAFRMMLIAVAITVGVFIGSMILFPVAKSSQRFLIVM
ncbi:hypothetical protein CBR_g23956 [Chara braunii]|nr:hypothetical protein CBR_g23956 [Chara braunii]|eukprot:GBG77512.1 hypothetical protein CBR_g23956 [Chara braunii]